LVTYCIAKQICIIFSSSVISWWSVLLVEGAGENHRPATNRWQTLSLNVVHLALSGSRTHNISGDRHRLHERIFFILIPRVFIGHLLYSKTNLYYFKFHWNKNNSKHHSSFLEKEKKSKTKLLSKIICNIAIYIAQSDNSSQCMLHFAVNEANNITYYF
jgi:hypothetical protein